MSRVLKQTDRTIEELRQSRMVIVPECSVVKNAETDAEQIVYCKNAFMFHERMCCQSYAFPKAKWRNGQPCPLASHREVIETKAAEKLRVGQQKQKKKSRRK